MQWHERQESANNRYKEKENLKNMKLKHLESALSNLSSEFPNPQVALEQYPTNAHLAAQVALTAFDRKDLFKGAKVMDLGCGTGMLSLACALVLDDLAYVDDESGDENEQLDSYDNSETEELDKDVNNSVDEEDQIKEHPLQKDLLGLLAYSHVVGVDIDESALEKAKTNKELLQELEYLELVEQSDEASEDSPELQQNCEGNVKVEFVNAVLKYIPPERGNKQLRQVRGRGKGRGNKNGKRNSRQNQIVSSTTNNSQNDTTGDNGDDLEHKDNLPFPSHSFDLVITNPPFGTKNNEGIDVAFLEAALRITRSSVYSFHKSSTREYLLKKFNDPERGLSVEVLAQMKFDIGKSYKFHKEKSVDVLVDLIRTCYTEPKSCFSGIEVS